MNASKVIRRLTRFGRSGTESRKNDPVKLVGYYMKLQEQYRDRLIDTTKETKRDDESAA